MFGNYSNFRNYWFRAKESYKRLVETSECIFNMFCLRDSCSKSNACVTCEKHCWKIHEHLVTDVYNFMLLYLECTQRHSCRKRTWYCNTDDTRACSSSEIQEKRNGQKKYLSTQTCSCYKASILLWKNDLVKILFWHETNFKSFPQKFKYQRCI